MDSKWRVGLTLMFWIVGIGITLVFLSNVTAGLLDDWLVVVPLVVTLFSTVTLWGIDPEKSLPDQSAQSTSEKKSDSTAYTMALLMEMMDDDERDEFKSQLKQRILSGESVTDASIIQEMEKRKRG